MQYTGVVRVAITVHVDGENSTEGLEASHVRIDDLMRRFLALAEEEGVLVSDVAAPHIVCY